MDRECNGYTYTASDDDGREKFNVSTDYIHGRIYLDTPDEDDIDSMKEFGKAILAAVRDMQRDLKRGTAEEIE